MKSPFSKFIIPLVVLLLVTCFTSNSLSQISNGPVKIVGEVGSKDATVSAELFVNPSVVLLDVSNIVNGDLDEFSDEQGQILGRLTTPLFPMPGRFEISLPIIPKGKSTDVDHDGKDEKDERCDQGEAERDP